MADFRYFLNRQGIQGRKGDKGDTGFSPTISVGTDTLNEYKLIIANEVNSFETPNLRGNINVLDNGGTYLRYDAETQQISAQGLDAATSTTVGGVLMSTASDIETMGDNTVITPANLADALPVYLQGEGAVTITQDGETSKTKINVDLSSVDELKSRVSAAEADIVGIQADITGIDADISTLNSVTANHTTSISAINNNITDLNNNKVAKTDFATTETAGIVKVDGTTITVDENGVISSVGGGSTGDVTAAGDNTFTGNNNFNGINSFNDYSYFNGNALFYKPIYANCYPDPIYYDNQTWSWSPAANTQFVMGKGLISLSSKSVTLETPDGKIGKAPLKNVMLTSSGDLILKANNNNIAGNISMSFIPRIKDGDGNIMLSQGNVTAGDNVTIEKTDAGIKINSTASGGAAIDDNNISTTTVYSSDKTVNLATNLVDNAMITLNQTKQDTLVSGTNIKTINGQSILGEGDITVSGGGSEAPTNMVTTDTAQDITGTKTFKNRINIGSSSTNIYSNGLYMEYTVPSGYSHRFYGYSVSMPNVAQIGKINFTTDNNTSTISANSGSGDILNVKGYKSLIKMENNSISIGAGSGTTTPSYLKVTPDSLTFKKSDGTSHDLLAGGSGSTNITSADSSITVTKSDTGVDIVANKDIVTGYAFPSNRYVALELGANGTAYTAPANGWYILHKTSGAAGEYLILISNSNKMRSDAWSSGNNQYAALFLPVKKGEQVNVHYTFTGKTNIFRFIYAEGAESEAQ